MILNRLGNKTKIAGDICRHFPKHGIYVDLFFGAGGMFFNKPKVKHNFLNDNDSDVYNLFMVLLNQKNELIDGIERMPIHEDLWQYWRCNRETDPIKRALRFVFLSNFGLYGSDRTLRLGANNTKQNILANIDSTALMLGDCHFMNRDFRTVLKAVEIKADDRRKVLVYADAPYLGTNQPYESRFNEDDSMDLFDLLQESGFMFSMSEERHPFIIDQAVKRGLNVISIGERRSINKRSEEILITNYSCNQQSLFN